MQAYIGDITELASDAVVNAANSSLLGGGGVDGAIHAADGPQLFEEYRRLGGCNVGEAKRTEGYRLPARYVIHTVGPRWRGGNQGEAELLGRCYRNCMEIARQNEMQSVAFPCISTGVYGYPSKAAADVAVSTVSKHLADTGYQCDVIFCCFAFEDFQIYSRLLKARAAASL